MTNNVSVIRGPVITYSDHPDMHSIGARMDYEPDAIIMMSNGRITEIGPAYKMKDKVPVGSHISESPSCRIIKISTQ